MLKPPLAPHQLQAHDRLDGPQSEGGGAPQEPRDQPHLVAGGEGGAKSAGHEHQTEYQESSLPADLISQNPSNEHSNSCAGEESSRADLGEDLVSTHQVELLAEGVGEPAGVKLPGGAGHGQVGGVVAQLDISVVNVSKQRVVPAGVTLD